MIKAVLEHQGGSVDLYEGETIVGRGLLCAIRFNDDTVSRRHVRLSVTAQDVTVTDLGSRNGTQVNNEPLTGTKTLSNQDVLKIGNVELRISLVTPGDFLNEIVTSPDAAREKVTSPTVHPMPRAAQQQNARPTGSQPYFVSQSAVPVSGSSQVRLVRESQELALPSRMVRTCPDCRTQVPVPQEQCHKCGYVWQLRGPLSKTQQIAISTLEELGIDQKTFDRTVEHRAAIRQVVEVPVIYHSSDLTFDAVARNLSRTGMFIASELLDAVGTSCTLRVLPDGGPAVSIGGVVQRVVTSPSDTDPQDAHPGMGIRFTKMSRDALAWTLSTLLDSPYP